MRCGIILAGGEGKRLQPFVYRLRGTNLPKQYVNFFDSRSLLERTFQRAEKWISPQHLFTVVNRHHFKFPEVRQQLSTFPSGRVIVQPANRETGPGLLLPLVHLYKRYPESTVVVLPSDHFILEEDLFMTYVDLAFRIVERNPLRIVLLGMEPSEEEPEYGYVLPARRVANLCPLRLYEVSQFIEKPDPRLARQMILKGGLWNTMVMVSKAKTLLDLAERTTPALFQLFKKIWGAIGTAREADVIEEAYRKMKPVNFSQGLLTALPRQRQSSLLVLPVNGVKWSDWGSERRIMSSLENPHDVNLSRQTEPNRLVPGLRSTNSPMYRS